MPSTVYGESTAPEISRQMIWLVNGRSHNGDARSFSLTGIPREPSQTPRVFGKSESNPTTHASMRAAVGDRRDGAASPDRPNPSPSLRADQIRRQTRTSMKSKPAGVVSPEDVPRYMSVADTAKALTLSPITILRWIRLGKLPAL